MKNPLSKISLLAASVIALVITAGCTINIGSQTPLNLGSQGHSMGQGGSSSEFSGMDIMFAQMMIPHHEQAVEMSSLAPGRAQNPAVLELAAQISAEQDPEIDQMKSWLESAGASVDMGHEMAMSGMLSDEEIDALSKATGAEFEELFLKGMIAHHEGAIDMAEMVTNSNNDEASALGEAIIRSQTEQIQYMYELLKNY